MKAPNTPGMADNIGFGTSQFSTREASWTAGQVILWHDIHYRQCPWPVVVDEQSFVLHPEIIVQAGVTLSGHASGHEDHGWLTLLLWFIISKIK